MEIEVMAVIEQMKLQLAEANYTIAVHRAHIAALETERAARPSPQPQGPTAAAS